MTTYHVWLTGQEQPEVVRADHVVSTEEGQLVFVNLRDGVLVAAWPILQRSEWYAWAVVGK